MNIGKEEEYSPAEQKGHVLISYSLFHFIHARI